MERAEIKEAEEKAAKDHKRVLIVFGANWRYDCHVLDMAFQRPDLAPVLERVTKWCTWTSAKETRIKI
jgi:hypothetical protein